MDGADVAAVLAETAAVLDHAGSDGSAVHLEGDEVDHVDEAVVFEGVVEGHVVLRVAQVAELQHLLHVRPQAPLLVQDHQALQNAPRVLQLLLQLRTLHLQLAQQQLYVLEGPALG